MAGDWIKMRTDLYRDPKVCLIADALLDPSGDLAQFVNQHLQCDMAVTRNVMRNVTVGALVTVWGVMRLRGKRIGVDLVCSKATVSVLDDMAELPGFGQAMSSVGWVEETEEGVVFPRFFDDYNVDPTDKKASSAAERQRRYRERSKAKSDANCDVTRDATVTHREEKSREETTTASLSHRAGAGEGGLLVTDANGKPTPPLDDAQAIGIGVPAAKRLRAIGIRVTALDPTLLALCAEKFTVEEMALMAAEQVLRKAHLWNDAEVHPELPELLASAATQQQMLLTSAQYASIQAAAAEIGIAYIAKSLRGRRQDAIDNQSPVRSVKHSARKPSATDNFEGKTYVGTAIDKLPPELRAGFERSLDGPG